MKKLCYLTIVLVSIALRSQSVAIEKVEWNKTFSINSFSNKRLNLIPFPKTIENHSGTLSFGSIVLSKKNSDDKLTEFVQKNFPVLNEQTDKTEIAVSYNENLKNEAYTLDIKKEGIKIEAKSKSGIFYALQTVKQLLTHNKSNYLLPLVHIKDEPTFAMRGFMIDVGRNFLSMPKLYQIIDEMAFYKYNTFHWHLTDNHAWRIESKKYPQLNDAAFHTPTRNPGDFYSYEQIRDLINYAENKNINIIPEIDMPGHSEVFTKAMGFKMNSEPGKEALKNILNEFFDEIPLKDCSFIHIGSDEAKAKNGEAFIQEMESHIKKFDRKIIAWSPGIKASDETWYQYWGDKKDPFPAFSRNAIDSQKNYINNAEPFTVLPQILFKPIGKGIRQNIKGGIICLWHDVNVNSENDIFELNPYYLALAAYAQNLWSAPIKKCSEHLEYHPPIQNNKLIQYFDHFENKLIYHQNKFHPQKSFEYVKQHNHYWKIYDPLNLNISNNLDSLTNQTHFSWGVGNTIYLKSRKYPWGFSKKIKKNQTVIATAKIKSSKNQTIPFWIQFETPMRANRSYGGIPQNGQWNNFKSTIKVNNIEISGPNWVNQGFKTEKIGGWGNKTEQEIPWFKEEFYWTRKPVQLKLKKGINKIQLVMPWGYKQENYMFTFAPLKNDGIEFLRN